MSSASACNEKSSLSYLVPRPFPFLRARNANVATPSEKALLRESGNETTERSPMVAFHTELGRSVINDN